MESGESGESRESGECLHSMQGLEPELGWGRQERREREMAGVGGDCQAGPRPGCCAETPAFSPESS